jgi:hypothetical protein
MSVLDGARLDRVVEARPVPVGRALATAAISVPYAVGWCARRLVLAAGYVLRAVAVGWQDAGRRDGAL